MLIEAVSRVIKGKTAEEAAEGVRGLYEKAKNLPGAALRENLKGKHAELLDSAEAKLNSLYELPAGKQWDMLRLQQLISEYLTFCGTLPLATLKVKELGGRFGEGKGERHAVGRLRKAEEGGSKVSTDDIKRAVRGLLDEDAVLAYACTQNLNDKMAPGTLKPDMVDRDPINIATFEKRVRPIVDRHVALIKQAFPNLFDAAWDKESKATDEMMEELDKRYPEARKSKFERHIGSLKEEKNSSDNELVEQLKKNLSAYVEEPPAEQEEEPDKGNSRKRPAEDSPDNGSGSKKRAKNDFNRTGQQPEKDVEQEVNDPIGQESEASETRSEIATQLLVAGDGTITEMLLEGRAKSPFPGTQGAHTTAWIVHTDFIGTWLIGKKVTEAITNLSELVKHVNDVELRLKSFDNGSITEGVAGMHISEPVGGEASATAKAESKVDTKTVTDDLVKKAQAAGAAGKPIVTQALLLQQVVGAVLERINIIPGVTLEAADTTGGREGEYRKMLRTRKKQGRQKKQEHQKKQGRQEDGMGPKDYQRAVFGLLDLKESLSGEQRLVLIRNHLAIIEGAYPGKLKEARLFSMKDDDAKLKKVLDRWEGSQGRDKEFVTGHVV